MSAELLNPPAPTFDHLGAPELWRCPKCGENILVYPALPVHHLCRQPGPKGGPRTFFFYYTMSEDNRIRSLHLVGADESDPHLRVEGFAADGSVHRWTMRRENGELVFYPFDSEQAREHCLGYSLSIQMHEPIPRRELERRAVRGRHSA